MPSFNLIYWRLFFCCILSSGANLSIFYLCLFCSIMNSLVIVLFLSGMVAMIMLRTLHKDIARYNQLDTVSRNILHMILVSMAHTIFCVSYPENDCGTLQRVQGCKTHLICGVIKQNQSEVGHIQFQFLIGL